jgi:hypothetical protein
MEPKQRKLPPGNIKGASSPENILVKRARAAQWIVEAASGLTYKQIAQKHDTTITTVYRVMKWAEREGFFEKADEAVRNRLVPIAIDAVEKKILREIAEGEAETALKILFGVRVLSTGGGPTRSDMQAADQSVSDAVETWEKFTFERAQRVTRNGEQTGNAESAPRDGAHGASEDPITVEAEIILPSSSEVGVLSHEEERAGDGEDSEVVE